MLLKKLIYYMCAFNELSCYFQEFLRRNSTEYAVILMKDVD